MPTTTIHPNLADAPVVAAGAPAVRAAGVGFNLTRRFSIISLGCILLVSGVSASLLSRFLVEQMLHRDAEVAMQFVQILSARPEAVAYFTAAAHDPVPSAEMEAFFERIRSMPDVLRANVYRTDRTVIWSSNRAAVGKTFELNPELDAALAGRLAVEADMLEHREYVKPEHVFGGSIEGHFVENYIPVWDEARRSVIGVVELYKEPRALFTTINRGLRLIWLCALVGTLLLFGALLWVVRRADAVIADQHARLVASATTTAVGDLAAAIAHGIRNPLAAIRSSAELLDEPHRGPPPDEAADIIAQVDRIEASIRTLLAYTQRPSSKLEVVDLNAVARAELAEIEPQLARRAIELRTDLAENLPAVASDSAMLAQILRTLMANALDAMDGAGRLAVRTRKLAHRRVELQVVDNGCGMTPSELERLFVPFHTTKKHGLGVGLPLVRRTLERLGGRISVASTPSQGTTVTLELPVG